MSEKQRDNLMLPSQVMARLGIRDVQKLYALIHSGELPAINIGTKGRIDPKTGDWIEGRATWRFRLCDVEAFEQSRRVGPLPLKPVPPKSLPVPTTSFLQKTHAAAS